MVRLIFPLVHKRLNHSLSHDYQYLQRSLIPTMHFQPSLPRLPIPKLEATCERYLAAQRPLLKDEAYRITELNVMKFRDTTGKQLHNLLLKIDKQNKHTSYISGPWYDMYLTARTPLPINYNPMMVFHNDERAEYNNQLLKAANLLISSLRFYKALNANILEPEVYHMNPQKSNTSTFRSVCSKIPSRFSWYAAYMHNAYPLDMSQYPKLFNSTRIPDLDKDRLFYDDKAKHILVQYKGNFYVFNVLNKDGSVFPPQEILAKLKYILNNNTPPAEFPIGVLTTLDRNKWASLRKHLELTNKEALKLVDSALFNLCLDEETVGTDPRSLSGNFLHGDGKNRWFDKSFSLLVSKDGVAAVNFEHAWGDGVAVLRYFQDVHKDALMNPQVHPETQPCGIDANEIQHLDIKLDDKMKVAITDAIKSYKNTYDSLGVNVLQLDGIGKRFCKNYAISPDAIMQLGFQDAYYRQTGKFVGSYESCSTAAFRHGRTETVRPCSTATKDYCKAVNSSKKPSNAELKQLVLKCSQVHGQLTKEAAMGQGFDRHLFALRLLGEQQNIQMDIFKDPAYAAINYNVLSTSTLSSPAVWAGGFGPVVQDGYGIAYSIMNDALGVLVTNYPVFSNGKDFVECLRQSYTEIRNILRGDGQQI